MLLSSPTAIATARWTPADVYAGALSCQIKLLAGGKGVPPKASLIFAFNPATGANRWVRITGGASGTVTLGQTGTIGGRAGGTVKSVRTSVPLNTWLKLVVTVGAGGATKVQLGTKTLFTTTLAPLASGQVGLSSLRSRVGFDSLVFRGNPDVEPCGNCHAGQAGQPLAANVYTYWDGDWWDSNKGGSGSVQQGGHGDPDGESAVTCTGTNGCHNMRLPTPGNHRNGLAEGSTAPATPNTYHLKAGFINTKPARRWDVQVTFDNYCAYQCHSKVSPKVPDMRHERDTSSSDPKHRSVEFGTHLTERNPQLPANVPVDSTLTSAAGSSPSVYAPCVACHDPHGTGTLDTRGVGNASGSNHMLRNTYSDPSAKLCKMCHI